MSFCATCRTELNQPDDPSGRTVDCGGDCRLCVVQAGDPDETLAMLESSINYIRKIQGCFLHENKPCICQWCVIAYRMEMEDSQ